MEPTKGITAAQALAMIQEIGDEVLLQLARSIGPRLSRGAGQPAAQERFDAIRVALGHSRQSINPWWVIGEAADEAFARDLIDEDEHEHLSPR